VSKSLDLLPGKTVFHVNRYRRQRIKNKENKENKGDAQLFSHFPSAAHGSEMQNLGSPIEVKVKRR
jgi:hypothetical protein